MIPGRSKSGIATFSIAAGTHCEEGMLSIEVVDNPVNPWFRPTVDGISHLFQPSIRADEPENRMAYALTALNQSLAPSSAQPINTPMPVVGDVRRMREFMQEHMEQLQKRSVEATRRHLDTRQREQPKFVSRTVSLSPAQRAQMEDIRKQRDTHGQS